MAIDFINIYIYIYIIFIIHVRCGYIFGSTDVFWAHWSPGRYQGTSFFYITGIFILPVVLHTINHIEI